MVSTDASGIGRQRRTGFYQAFKVTPIIFNPAICVGSWALFKLVLDVLLDAPNATPYSTHTRSSLTTGLFSLIPCGGMRARLNKS